MKTVNESVKYLEKYFTSEKITLIDSDGKEFDRGVSYCKYVKGFFKYIKKNFVIYLPPQAKRGVVILNLT